MKVKRYEVTSVQEALNRIKEELGPEAIVISTKTLKNTEPRIIEVIAAVDYGGDLKTEMPKDVSPEVVVSKRFASRLDWLEGNITELKDALSRLENRWNIQRELHDLRDRIDALFEFLHMESSFSGNDQLGRVYSLLLKNGISKPLASRIMCQVRSDPLFGAAKTVDDLLRIVERVVEGVIEKEKEKPAGRVKIFVGPPGVGKTTTVAKLAARFQIDEGKKTALISTDTYRIAAGEQLKIYAKILGVPVRVVEDKNGFKKSLEDFSDRDVILVDTAGRPSHDSSYLNRLREMFMGCTPADVYLLLSATSSSEHLIDVSSQFSLLDYNHLIFTKMDECQRFGSLLDVIERTRKPVEYITNGQNVPQDIRRVSSELVARLITRNHIH